MQNPVNGDFAGAFREVTSLGIVFFQLRYQAFSLPGVPASAAAAKRFRDGAIRPDALRRGAIRKETSSARTGPAFQVDPTQ